MQNSHRETNQLRRVRQRLNLEQKQLASLLQVKKQTISRYENGKSMPMLETAIRMEIVCGVPLRALFPHVYEKLRADTKRIIEADRTLTNRVLSMIRDACPYEEKLDLPAPSEEILHMVRDHVTQVAKKLTPLWPSK